MLGCFVFAVHRLTMAQTYSLFMVAPLLMTALSVPMHGEVVTGRRWCAIVVGMGGVLIILHPWSKGSVSFTAAAAAAAATVCYSLSALTVRSLGRSNSNIGTIFWNFTLVGLGSGLSPYSIGVPCRRAEWPWLAGIGIAGALGQYWITDAFRRAPPSVVGPFEYTSLLWAFAIDWIFWSASPSASLLAGAAVVVACGTYVIWDERRSGDLALITRESAALKADRPVCRRARMPPRERRPSAPGSIPAVASRRKSTRSKPVSAMVLKPISLRN